MSDGETSIYTGSSYREAVSTLHVTLENGLDLHVNEHQKIRHYRGRSTGEFEEEEEEEAGAHLNCTIMRCYTLILLEISRRKRWWCLKCVIVYLARDIPPFVMYCVNGKPRSSLLIESTDSMISAFINV